MVTKSSKRLIAVYVMTALLSLMIIPTLSVSAASGDTTVYLTKTGSCYHASGCSSLRKSQIPTTLSDAVAGGYSPCSKCHPGSLDAAPTNNVQTASAPAPVVQNPTAVNQVKTSGWDCIYNEAYYRANNPDVDKVYPGDSAGIFEHFKTSGMKEGRRGCDEFDVSSYRSKNADLNATFGDDLPKYYYHYMQSGKAEGRSGK
jgi:hypothetical protein